MREICTSGSEGGGAGTTGAPYPYHDFAVQDRRKSWVAGLRRPRHN
jgi:hypothetical protein